MGIAEGLHLFASGDSGVGLDTPGMIRELQSDGIPDGSISDLLLTHYHRDHAGGAAGLSVDPGAPVMYSPLTADVLRAGVHPPEVTFSVCPDVRAIEPGQQQAYVETIRRLAAIDFDMLLPVDRLLLSPSL